jgi:hypothetical protein
MGLEGASRYEMGGEPEVRKNDEGKSHEDLSLESAQLQQRLEQINSDIDAMGDSLEMDGEAQTITNAEGKSHNDLSLEKAQIAQRLEKIKGDIASL